VPMHYVFQYQIYRCVVRWQAGIPEVSLRGQTRAMAHAPPPYPKQS